jgi:site-specific DNA-methyltransferase (adenine-specific)
METVKTFNVDCLGDEGLCKIQDKSIDMILCDLPYGITESFWDKVLDHTELFKQYDRIIKENGAIALFGSQPFTTDIINADRKRFRYSLVWDNNIGTDFFNCNVKPIKSHEDILMFYKKKPTYNPQMEEGKTNKTKDKEEFQNNTTLGKLFKRSSIDNKGTKFPKTV